MKEEFKNLLQQNDYKKCLSTLNQMKKLLNTDLYYFEEISLFLNKALVYSKMEDWLSVVNETLKGLDLIKHLKSNYIKFSKLSQKEKQTIKTLEKK